MRGGEIGLPISEWEKTITELGESGCRTEILPILKLLVEAREVSEVWTEKEVVGLDDDGNEVPEIEVTFWIRRGR